MIQNLPPPPDFKAIDAAALRTADRRTRVLALVGNLVFCWSNNESMLIYLLMLLLKVDPPSAAIVFSTLNTTRARLDLIDRLAKAKIRDRTLLSSISKLTRKFAELTRDRNELNHCIFALNEQGDITHTQSTRVHEIKGEIRIGEIRKMDEQRIKEMTSTTRNLTRLNRSIWDLLPVLDAYLRQEERAHRNASPAA